MIELEIIELRSNTQKVIRIVDIGGYVPRNILNRIAIFISDNMGYIYQIRNKLTGKKYIGQTENLEDRWRQHVKPNSNCRYLKYAFNKYGLDNFEFKLLFICFDGDMDAYEVEYIRKYNTLVPNGYNLRDGGNNGKHHEETKKKISSTLKSQNIVYAKPQLGKPHTEEVKEKISRALKGRKLSSVAYLNLITRAKQSEKPVVQLTLSGVVVSRYDSISSAGVAMNVSKTSIHKACQGSSKTSQGFKWMYEVDYQSLRLVQV